MIQFVARLLLSRVLQVVASAAWNQKLINLKVYLTHTHTSERRGMSATDMKQICVEITAPKANNLNKLNDLLKYALVSARLGDGKSIWLIVATFYSRTMRVK